MKQPLSPQEAQSKVEAWCARSEHCLSEAQEKLCQWGVPPDCIRPVLRHLLTEGFIDETRYARAFAHDKYQFNDWGKQRIIQALHTKRLPETCIGQAIDGIDLNDYLQRLRSLLQRKRDTLPSAPAYELRGRLIRFALGKGYDMDDIMHCLGTMEDPE